MFVRKNIGAWCNGNTWVSKTFVVSSNLTAPAKLIRAFCIAECSNFMQSADNRTHFFKRISEEMDVNVVGHRHIRMSEQF